MKLDEDTVGKALRRLGLTRKKATEQTRPDVVAKRDDFLGQAARIEPGQAHFIDEAGTHVAMTRDLGRVPRGERVVDHVPRNRGTVCANSKRPPSSGAILPPGTASLDDYRLELPLGAPGILDHIRYRCPLLRSRSARCPLPAAPCPSPLPVLSAPGARSAGHHRPWPGLRGS